MKTLQSVRLKPQLLQCCRPLAHRCRRCCAKHLPFFLGYTYLCRMHHRNALIQPPWLMKMSVSLSHRHHEHQALVHVCQTVYDKVSDPTVSGCRMNTSMVPLPGLNVVLRALHKEQDSP